MLTLRRKKNEAIQIGPDVTVWVSQIRGSSVLLAIEAPKGVTILRRELDPLHLDAEAADSSNDDGA